MTAEQVLETARAELGNTESPAGSNRTKYGKWYGLDGQPWCMMFVQWCFDRVGAASLLPIRTASCGTLMRAAQKAGLWVTRGYLPGDVVIYDFSGKRSTTEHTGIVERVTASGIIAIEGNTSVAGSQSNGGEVCRKSRRNGLIIGAVRPKYEEVDHLDIEKLTDAELVRLAEQMQAALARQPVGTKLAPEFQEAMGKGITDGTRPGALVTRAQAAVMALRAAKAAASKYQ